MGRDVRSSSVSAIELSDLLGIPYPRIHEELKRLERVGLLVDPDVETSGRVVNYKVVESVYWGACSQLLNEAQERPRMAVRSAGGLAARPRALAAASRCSAEHTLRSRVDRSSLRRAAGCVYMAGQV